MKPLALRLWARTDRGGPDDCWPWMGWRHPGGHGQIGRGTRAQGLAYTHIVSWEIANGPVPKGLYVCHKCDNPPCVNPKHLFLGTAADNTADMIAKRRHMHGETAPWSKLADVDIRAIKVLIGEGQTQRAIAGQFGVSRALIGLIGQGKRWTHLP